MYKYNIVTKAHFLGKHLLSRNRVCFCNRARTFSYAMCIRRVAQFPVSRPRYHRKVHCSAHNVRKWRNNTNARLLWWYMYVIMYIYVCVSVQQKWSTHLMFAARQQHIYIVNRKRIYENVSSTCGSSTRLLYIIYIMIR